MTSVLNSFWLGIKVPLRKAVYWLQYNLLKRKRNAFNILMAEETIDYIVKHECSVCRYGDGEIDMITCLKEGFDESRKSDFQTYDEKLAWRLKQILGNGFGRRAEFDSVHSLCMEKPSKPLFYSQTVHRAELCK